MLTGKWTWRKNHDNNRWTLWGTTTHNAILHQIDDPAYGTSHRLYGTGEQQAPRLVTFKVPGGTFWSGIGSRDYAPATFQTWRILEGSVEGGFLKCEAVCEVEITSPLAKLKGRAK